MTFLELFQSPRKEPSERTEATAVIPVQQSPSVLTVKSRPVGLRTEFLRRTGTGKHRTVGPRIGFSHRTAVGPAVSGETTPLAADHHALPHSPSRSRPRNKEARLLAHISAHLFFAAQGEWGGCQSCPGIAAARVVPHHDGRVHAGHDSGETRSPTESG
jgi:hypothetical protein